MQNRLLQEMMEVVVRKKDPKLDKYQFGLLIMVNIQIIFS